MPFESVMPSNQLILCHPLFLLRSIFPSIRVFSNESAIHIRWPKYQDWCFSFSISPSKEYSALIPGLICFLAFQGTLTVHQISSQNIMKKRWSTIGRRIGGVYWTLEIKNIPHREKDRTSLFECEKLSWSQKLWDCPDGSDGEEFACNEGDMGWIPGLRRPPGEENGNSGAEPSSSASPALAGGAFTTEPPGKPNVIKHTMQIYIQNFKIFTEKIIQKLLLQKRCKCSVQI